MRSAAAFGRLCVETRLVSEMVLTQNAAAFGRLCVETAKTIATSPRWQQPPSGGCVLKLLTE